MMNEEAASHRRERTTHFMNPHGLTNPEHYTSVYDIYLIFQDSTRSMTPFRILSAAKIIMQNIREADGSSAAMTWESTNHYFTNEAQAPDNVIDLRRKDRYYG